MEHFRRIALLRPRREQDVKSSHAMQLFSSMLWAFKGTTRSAWETACANDADVVVFHAEDGRDDDVSQWQANGKLAVVITTDLMSAPATRHALMYPFRAAQVFELLENLDAQLRLVEQSSGDSKGSCLASDGCWAFSEALRALRAQPDSGWFVASRGVDPIVWVKAARGGYFAESHHVAAIRNGTVSLRGLTLEPVDSPPAGAVPRPEVELSWFAACHADDSLIRDLRTARHRIVRWPDCGSIRPPTSQLRTLAVLAAQYVDVDQLAERARVTPTEATCTLNALAVHGLLTSSDPALPQTAHASELSRGALRGLLGKIRRRLGLGA